MTKAKDYLDSPLWDGRLSLEERLDYLMGELTLEEKLRCLGTGCPAIERLGIPEFSVGGEGAHGVQARHDQKFDKGVPQPTTILPNPIGMSATWDVELMEQAGQVVGNEARAIFHKNGKGSLCLWAPTVDMERDPRWGRTEEAYGEDPYLAGKMSAAYVRGMRGEDPFYIRCGATLKHFYANNVEEGRVWKSSSIDPRNKQEYYLEPFRRGVMEGGAEGIMTAYNEINGTPCILNDEMQRIAKDQWGVHHIVCDGGDMKQTVEFHRYFGSHTETIAAALKAGLDCFTDEMEDVVEGAREAYELGMITMQDIDRALRCHFGTMIRLGLFDADDACPYVDIGEEHLNSRENQLVSYEMAKESVILLKNENVPGENKNGSGKEENAPGEGAPLLPLIKNQAVRGGGRQQGASFGGPAGECCGKGASFRESVGRIAVLGPLSHVWYKDWYSGIPPYHVTPWEGLCRYQREGWTESLELESGLPHVKLGCEQGWLGILEDGDTVGLVPEEQAEVFEVTLWDHRQATLRSLGNGLFLTTEDGQDDDKNYRRGIVTASSEEAFGWFVKEAFHLTWEGESLQEALTAGKEIQLRAWNDAEYFVDGQDRLRVQEEGGFVEDGCVVPWQEGRSVEDGCVAPGQEGSPGDRYWRLPPLRPVLVKDGIGEAVSMAAGTDTVLLFGGANSMINCKEEVDRQDLELPLYQRELIQAVYQANSRVVLILVSSIPFGITWEKEHLPAILTMAPGSMELGNALADVLFGKAAPAGRLSMTWYRDVSQLPDIDDYDIIQGERTYQYFRGEVLYPFGHGLTYSPVGYVDLQVEVREEKEAGEKAVREKEGRESAYHEMAWLEVSLTLENQGSRETDEVAQIYVTKKDSAVKRPLRQLKGFRRVKALPPGERRTVRFEIPLEDLKYYDVVARRMLVEPGEYEIQAGASSQDIRLRGIVVLDGVSRGVRNGVTWNPADHYDASRNAILWEGHMKYASVVHTEHVGQYAVRQWEQGEVEGLNQDEICDSGKEGKRGLESPMELVYERVSLPTQPSCLILDAEMAKGVEVEVYADDTRISVYRKQYRGRETAFAIQEDWGNGAGNPRSGHGDGFEMIRIPVSMVPVEKEFFRLKLVCHGPVKICRWRWEAGDSFDS